MQLALWVAAVVIPAMVYLCVRGVKPGLLATRAVWVGLLVICPGELIYMYFGAFQRALVPLVVHTVAMALALWLPRNRYDLFARVLRMSSNAKQPANISAADVDQLLCLLAQVYPGRIAALYKQQGILSVHLWKPEEMEPLEGLVCFLNPDWGTSAVLFNAVVLRRGVVADLKKLSWLGYEQGEYGLRSLYG